MSIIITYATHSNPTAETRVDGWNLDMTKRQIVRDGGTILEMVPEHSLIHGPVQRMDDGAFVALLDMILAYDGGRVRSATGLHLRAIRAYLAGPLDEPGPDLLGFRFFEPLAVDGLWPTNRFMQAVYLDAVNRFREKQARCTHTAASVIATLSE